MSVVEKHKAYAEAPLPLHRLCSDLTYYPPSCLTIEDALRFSDRDVATSVSGDGTLRAVQYGKFGANLHNVAGVSMIAQRDCHCMRAAHDLVRNGRRIPCLVHKQGVAAPPRRGTA
jgi:hypothetical protein